MCRILTALLFLLADNSFAKSEWLCTEASSQRRGDSIYSCGIGSGKDENEARLNAFDNSKKEFNRICDSSDDCKGHEISVNPERTACEKGTNTFKCYRLIVFTINEKAKNGTAKSPSAETNIVLKDQPDKFESFEYSSIETLPKVKRGMKKVHS